MIVWWGSCKLWFLYFLHLLWILQDLQRIFEIKSKETIVIGHQGQGRVFYYLGVYDIFRQILNNVWTFYGGIYICFFPYFSHENGKKSVGLQTKVYEGMRGGCHKIKLIMANSHFSRQIHQLLTSRTNTNFSENVCLAVSYLLLFWWNFHHPPKVM